MRRVSANVIGLVHSSHHRRILVFISLFVAVLGIALSWYRADVQAPQSDYAKAMVRLNGRTIQAEIADTSEKRQKGLGGRDGLEADNGMLFVFEAADEHCFWMKDVDFAIDIIWFDDNKDLVHLEESVDPASYPDSFCPPEPAKYVLEITAGSARDLNVSENTQLEVDNL